MQRQVIHPADRAHWLKLRVADITSTEVSALFGFGYESRYALWHRKREQRDSEIEQTERMKWGTRLQDVIAMGICEDEGWGLRAKREYIRLPDYGIGSSFDFEVTDAGKNETAILEVKSVDALIFNRGWVVEDGVIEAPEHIELQVQHQMLVDGTGVAYIGALVGNNQVALLRREAIPAVHERIVEAAGSFWASIAANKPPEPDYATDLDVIRRLNGYAEPGRVVDRSRDAGIAALCAEYAAASKAATMAEEDRKVAAAKLLMQIGDAEKVIANGFTISAGMVGPAEIAAYTRAGYRNLRVYPKKAAK